MNKYEKKKLTNFLLKTPEVIRLFTPEIIRDSLLEDGKKLVYEETEDGNPFDLIFSNTDKIDFKKFALYAAYSSKLLSTYSTVLSEAKNIIPTPELSEKCLKFARENISEGENITTFVFVAEKKIGIFEINSKKELYGKDVVPKKFRINSDLISDLIGATQLESIKFVFSDEEFANTMYDVIAYNTLVDMGYSREDIKTIMDKNNGMVEVERSEKFLDSFLRAKRDLFAVQEILSRVNEDNLYITAGYQMIGKLGNDAKLYHDKLKNNQEKEVNLFSLQELKRIEYLFKQIESSINPNKVTVSIKFLNNNKILNDITVDKFSEDYKKALTGYANVYISENHNNLFNPDILAFLDKKTALEYVKGIAPLYQSEYYFLLYEANCLTFQEAMDKIKELDLSEDELGFFRIRAVDRYLAGRNNTMMNVVEKLGIVSVDEDSHEIKKTEGNSLEIQGETFGDSLLKNIERPEVMFSKAITDPGLYELLDDSLKTQFFHLAMIQYISNGKYKDVAKKDVRYFIEQHDLAFKDYRVFYSTYGLNPEELENLIGIENVKDSFTPEGLLETINEIKQLEQTGLKNKKDKDTYEFALKDYEFYKQVYKRYNLLEQGDNEENILEVFDDLIFDDDMFTKLYVDGFVSAQTLYEYNNNLAEKIFREGQLKDEDTRDYILKSNIDLSIGEIIRLNQKNILSNEDVLDFYMNDKINLDDLTKYAEDTNFKQILKDSELLNLAKKYSMIKKDDTKHDFFKYLNAYMQFKDSAVDIQDKLYKAIGGKRARNDDLLELYTKGALDIKTIDPDDDLILSMIKQGRLKSGDEEYLFKDTDMQGTKYIRLMSILRKLDNDDEKLNLLAGVYKTEDEISIRRLNLLANELSDAFNEEGGVVLTGELLDDDKTNAVTKAKDKNGGTSKVKAVRSLAKMFDTFKSIKPDYEHIIVAGTYVAFLDDSALVEEILRKSADGNTFMTTHATYKISEEFFKYLLKETYDNDLRKNLYNFFIDVNRDGKPYFKWSLLTAAKRKNITGIDRVIHGKSWADRLKSKMKKTDIDEKELNDLLDEIADSSKTEELEER